MRNKYIESFEKAQIAEKNVPDFRAGDTLRVAVDRTLKAYVLLDVVKELVKLLWLEKLVLTLLVLREFFQYILIVFKR